MLQQVPERLPNQQARLSRLKSRNDSRKIGEISPIMWSPDMKESDSH
jgi:hypothetical protein